MINTNDVTSFVAGSASADVLAALLCVSRGDPETPISAKGVAPAAENTTGVITR